MTVLVFPPGSSEAALVAADIVLVLHIVGGGVAIASGAVALLARKGESLHRAAGTLFFLSMLLTTAIGATVSPFLTDGQRPNTVAGVLAFYLVLTAWTAVRHQDGGIDRFAIAGFFVALGSAVAGVLFALEAQSSPTGTIDGAPPQAFTVFMIVGGIAAAGDLKVILRGGILGAPRIARHLWRMCFGLVFASGSFFLGQQQVFPASLRGSSILLVPTLAPLAFLLFWLVRVRLTNWINRAERAPA